MINPVSSSGQPVSFQDQLEGILKNSDNDHEGLIVAIKSILSGKSISKGEGLTEEGKQVFQNITTFLKKEGADSKEQEDLTKNLEKKLSHLSKQILYRLPDHVITDQVLGFLPKASEGTESIKQTSKQFKEIQEQTPEGKITTFLRKILLSKRPALEGSTGPTVEGEPLNLPSSFRFEGTNFEQFKKYFSEKFDFKRALSAYLSFSSQIEPNSQEEKLLLYLMKCVPWNLEEVEEAQWKEDSKVSPIIKSIQDVFNLSDSTIGNFKESNPEIVHYRQARYKGDILQQKVKNLLEKGDPFIGNKSLGFIGVSLQATYLSYLNKSLKKDKDIVLAAVNQNSFFAFQRADESLRKDKDFILAAIKLSEQAIIYADESLMKDKDLILEVVKQNGANLRYADESLMKDKEVVLAAVKQYGGAFPYADESLKNDKEVVLAAVKQDGGALRYVDENFKKDKEVVLAAIKSYKDAHLFADKSLMKDKDFVLEIVKQNGKALQSADESLTKDKDIVLAAVKQNGMALLFAERSLREDKDIVLAAVKQNGAALQIADESLKKDKEVVLAAVKQDGGALRYADESLRKDKEVVLAAVKQNGAALQFADTSLREDKEVVLAAS